MGISRLISGSFDINDIPPDIFDDLHPPVPQATKAQLASADLDGGTNKDLAVGQNNTANFTIKDINNITPIKFTGRILTRNQDYQVWYRYRPADTNSDWHRLDLPDKNIAARYNELQIGDLRQLRGYNTALATTTQKTVAKNVLPTTATVQLGATLQRKNTLEVLVAPVTDNTTGKPINITATTPESDVAQYQITKINLVEKGQLLVTVPGKFNLLPNAAEQTYQAQLTATATNAWRLRYSLSLGYDDQLDDQRVNLFPVTAMTHIKFKKPNAAAFSLTPDTVIYPILEQTSAPPSNTDTVELTMTATIRDLYGQMIQPGQSYYYPLRWTLNYNLDG